MTDIRTYSDDFFKIGNIAVLQRNTGNDKYDFNFRNYFDCNSVVSEIDAPVLLHIGAVEDYAGVERAIEDRGMKLLVHEAEHLRNSTIEEWYPVLKDRTPFTKIYDELPDVEVILQDFSFPVFIKGNRQTNKHKRSQCIIENADQYEALRKEWKHDIILSWQKVAVREYVKLQEIDSKSFPDMVPISYEFRFFYFEGKFMAYGPYWYMGTQYTLPDEELQTVVELTDWAADRMATSFIAIDVAKTASGDWIIIEVNDAQESGFVGINPFELWNNTIDAMQNRNWISVEDLIEEGTVIMCGEPYPDKTPEDIWNIAKSNYSIQELVDAYVIAHNEFWWVEDERYDYEEDTDEYDEACEITDAWGEVMDHLCDRLVAYASDEGILAVGESHYGLKPFMEKYGYRDGHGWWVKL